MFALKNERLLADWLLQAKGGSVLEGDELINFRR